MPDIAHIFGDDLTFGPTGDLLPVDGPQRGVERVLRRLCTNQKAYIWNLTYGAGLPRRVGDTLSVPVIQAIVRSQILLEPAVAPDPAPQITVKPFLNGASVHIVYMSTETGQQETLAFDVDNNGDARP